MKFVFSSCIASLFCVSSVGGEVRVRKAKVDKEPTRYPISTPHEIHEYQQVKFVDENLWECYFDGVSGCMACENNLSQGPNSDNTGALIVDLRAQYKGPSW
ncbi:hypothetical protein ACHAW6_004498, partial [Cyclotella cf. meneghiniana]